MRLSSLAFAFVAITCSCGSSSPSDSDGGTTNDGGTTTDGATTTDDGGALHGGNPGACTAGVPATGKPADTSTPTTVVGTGTADSCTFTALNAAVPKGGVITFSCGSAPVTIPVTATMNLPTNKDTVIDGGDLVTLDGQNQVGSCASTAPVTGRTTRR